MGRGPPTPTYSTRSTPSKAWRPSGSILKPVTSCARRHEHHRMRERHPRRLVVEDHLRLPGRARSRSAWSVVSFASCDELVVVGVAPFGDVVAAEPRGRAAEQHVEEIVGVAVVAGPAVERHRGLAGLQLACDRRSTRRSRAWRGCRSWRGRPGSSRRRACRSDCRGGSPACTRGRCRSPRASPASIISCCAAAGS